MTDESAEGVPLGEAATPGRSLRGAAEDLSSLFGEEAFEPDPGATALGPQRPPETPEERLSHGLDALARRIAALELQLAGAVEHVQSVDRHLASTYQALQGVLQSMPEAGSGATTDLNPLTARLEALAADVARSGAAVRRQVDELPARIGSLQPPARPGSDALEARLASVEEAVTAMAARLRALEEGVGATLAHAEAGGEALARLERSVAALSSTATSPTGPDARPEPAREPDARSEWTLEGSQTSPTAPATPVVEDPLLAQLEETGPAPEEARAVSEDVSEVWVDRPPTPPDTDARDEAGSTGTAPFWSAPNES